MVDVGWLCFTPHRQRGHFLETAPPFTVPSKGHEAQVYTPFPSGIKPGSLRGSPLYYCCATPAPHLFGTPQL